MRSARNERIICSSNAIGVAKGLEPREVAYSAVAADFIPGLGLSEEDATRILRDNPREFITVRENN